MEDYKFIFTPTKFCILLWIIISFFYVFPNILNFCGHEIPENLYILFLVPLTFFISKRFDEISNVYNKIYWYGNKYIGDYRGELFLKYEIYIPTTSEIKEIVKISSEEHSEILNICHDKYVEDILHQIFSAIYYNYMYHLDKSNYGKDIYKENLNNYNKYYNRYFKNRYRNGGNFINKIKFIIDFI